MEENTHLVDKVVDAFRKAATELEELQVQAALGKAEAKDKYEDIKKKFNGYVHDVKSKYNSGKEKVEDLHQKFDELRLQLALGKAETIEAFQEQKKKILLKVHDIEHKIKHNETLNRVYAVLLIEIEKFKIQLEWLEGKYKEGKENVGEAYEKSKETFFEYLDKLKSKLSGEDKSRWDNFQDEMGEAFSHFKQAFSKG